MDVACDMDGVLTRFVPRLFDEYYARYGVRYYETDVIHHDLVHTVGEAVYEQMQAIFNEPGFFDSLPPYEENIEVIVRLAEQGHHIEICTAPTTIEVDGVKQPNPHCIIDKFKWLARHLPKQVGRNVTIQKNKRMTQAHFFADDGDHNILPWCAQHKTGTALLIPRPWNEKVVLPVNALRLPLTELPGLIGKAT